VAIGLALMPVVLLKVGSTGWRFVTYDRTDRACVRRGRSAVLAVVLATPAGDYLHLYPLHYWRAGGS
jgi:hypothetical protein